MRLKEIYRKNWFFIIIYALLVVAAFMLKINFYDRMMVIDGNIVNFVQSYLITDFNTTLMKILSILGSYYVIPVLCLILFLIIKDKRVPISIILIMIFTVLFNLIMKFAIKRPRPVSMLVEESFYSFPSGHAMCSVVFYGLILYLIGRKNDDYIINIVMSFIVIMLILGICFSRIYLNVHYFSDVVFGIIYGIVTLILSMRILDNYDI